MHVLISFENQLHRILQFIKQARSLLPVMVYVVLGISFLLTIFPLRFLLSVAGLLYLIKRSIDSRLETISRKGLVAYIGPKARNALFHRSIFDVMCDLWYYPMLGLYVKAIMGPFIVKPRPEDVVHTLDELPEAGRKALLTKGVVYVLPRWLRRIVLPKSFEIHSKIHDFMEAGDEAVASGHLTLLDPAAFRRETPTNAGQKPGASFLSPTRHEDELSAISAQTHSPDDSFVGIENNVIIGSEILRQLKHLPGRLSSTWDGLQTYSREQAERRRQSTPATQGPPVSPLAMVAAFIETHKKRALRRLPTKRLFGILGVCLLGLSAKVAYSKRYRRLTVQLLVTVSFFGLTTLGVGSLAALALKVRETRATSMQKSESTA